MTHTRTDEERQALVKRRESAFFAIVGFVVRFVMLVAVLATFGIAVALLAYGAIETWHLVDAMIRGTAGSRDDVMLHAIEIVDTFLVAMVVVVVSVGIYQLFINQRIPVPAWLRIDDIDDLKAKLIGVVITVLGVYFLGTALAWEYGEDLLPLGLSTAAIVLVLTYFLSVHFRHEKKGEEAAEE